MKPWRPVAVMLLLASAAAAEPRSGFLDLGPETRAMQTEDALNPGMLWVLDGAELWRRREGAAGKACADCHGEAAVGMRGVAARYPAFDTVRSRPLDLEGRLQMCRRDHQRAPALPAESDDLLALLAFVAHQSRGMPAAAGEDPQLAPFIAQGRALFGRRQGQLDLACATCHEAHAGARLGGSLIPQGHPNGYPLYRLEWQGLGSFQRRLRNCMQGIRAEPYPRGGAEAVALELFLMVRARGLPIETPAVRP